MATDLERLVVSLSADIKAYEKALAKAQGVTTSALRKIENDANKSMGRIEKAMGRVGSAVSGFGKGLLLGGIAAGVAGLTQLVVSSVSTAAAIGDLSDKLGITSDKLQELQYGAVQANLGFADLEKGLLKFSKSLGEAQNGSGELFKILQANGFSQAQIQALNYSQALDVVADLIKNAKNAQDGLLVSTAGFGKGAADEFLEFLRNGKGGLDGFANSARKAGDVIDRELIKAAQVLDDAWASVMNSMTKQTATFVLTTIKEFQALGSVLDTLSAKSAGVMAGRFAMSPQQAAPFLPAPAAPKPLSPSPPSNFAGSGGFTKPTPTVMPPSPEDIKRQNEYNDSKAKQKAAIEGVLEALKFENEQLNRSELSQAIANEQRKAGVTATSEQGKAIEALVTKNFELAQSQEAAITAGEAFLESQEAMRDAFMDLAEIGVDALDAIVVGGEKAEDVLKGLVKQLASAAIKALLLGQGPLAGLFGGGGGLLGGLFGGARADGGPVTAGKTYLVGERGPEWFKAGQSGQIIPNKAAGGQQVITFAPQIDARGADAGAVARLTADLRAMQRDFAKNVRNTVSGEKSLNPRFAR